MESGVFSEIKNEVEFNDFNEAFLTDAMENEPHTIGVFIKCERFNSSSGNTDFVDHKDTIPNCQEQSKEKNVINSKISGNSSINECNAEKMKRDDDFVFRHKDIDSESVEKKKSSELFSFCEMCIKSFATDTYFSKTKSNEFQCSCQEQNEVFYNEDEDLTVDVKPSSLGNTTVSRLQLMKVQEETMSGNEDNFELASSAKPQKNYERTLSSNPLAKVPESCPLVKHQGNKPFLCKICSKSFRHSYNLKIHQRIHIGENPFHCNFCSKSFGRKGSLIVHEKTHTGEKPYCKICSKSFAYSGALTIHERIHTGEKSFYCIICSKAFNNSTNLRVHERIHTGEIHTGIKPLQCKTCFKTFNYSSHLTSHERIHTGEKPFICKICSKSFSQKCTLNNHKKVHTGETSVYGNTCSKAFTNSGHLKIQERILTGEKPLQCKTCLKTFNYSSHLTSHERMHTGEKPFICKTCSKSFGYKRSLRVHEKIHLGEKPYSCKICPKSFCRKSSLILHEKVHIEEKHIAKSETVSVVPAT